MNSVALRERVCDDLLTLPEDALLAVREFVLFQKSRREAPSAKQTGVSDSEKRAAAFAELLKFKGTIDRDIDIAKELGEALDEKYNRSF
jgi:hypothetical protein